MLHPVVSHVKRSKSDRNTNAHHRNNASNARRNELLNRSICSCLKHVVRPLPRFLNGRHLHLQPLKIEIAVTLGFLFLQYHRHRSWKSSFAINPRSAVRCILQRAEHLPRELRHRWNLLFSSSTHLLAWQDAHFVALGKVLLAESGDVVIGWGLVEGQVDRGTVGVELHA